MSSGTEASALPALEKMRSRLLIAAAGWFLVGLAVTTMLYALLAYLSASPKLAALLIVIFLYGGAAALVVGGLLTLASLYTRFVPGLEELARARSGLRVASRLIKVGYLGGLTLLTAAALLVEAALLLPGVAGRVPVTTLVLAFVACYAPVLLGHAGAALLCFKLYSVYRGPLYPAAGVLTIPSMILPALSFAPYILLRAALGNTISRLRAQAT